MAAKIRNLGTRSLSAAVFVVLLMGSLLWNYYSFTVFFFLVALIGLHEFYRLALHAGTHPYRGSGIVLGALCYLSFVRWDFISGLQNRIDAALCVSISGIVILSMAMLRDKTPDGLKNAMVTMAGIVYVVLPFGLMHRLVIVPFMGAHYRPDIVVGIILLLWTNDTFAYIWGSLFGKRKLIERVSPGKTWEGTVLGALTAFAAAFLVQQWESFSHDAFWPALGLIIPIVGTTGDLAESYLKRIAGVKDSGRIMPGHGGVLDRFDSLLFVIPVVLLIVSLSGGFV